MASKNVGKQSSTLKSHIGSTGGGAKRNGGPREKNTLLSSTMFDCVAPPPINTMAATFIPRALNKRRRRRKVSVEVHKVLGSDGAASEECIVRLLAPTKDKTKRKSKSSSPTNNNDDDEDDDDMSTVVPREFMNFVDDGPELINGSLWKAKYRIPLKAITIKGTRKNGICLEISVKALKQVRELIFDTEDEAEKFYRTLSDEFAKDQARREARVKAALGGTKINAEDKITFLLEVVSAWDIPVGDLISSDPYVQVTFNGVEVHKTKHISKTLDPIWTIKTDSLFLFTVTSQELFTSDGLLFVLKDFDKLGGNEKLGVVNVPAKTIYEAKGERMEFKLQPHGYKSKEVPGYMAVRCRRASTRDIKFMEERSKPISKQLDFLHKAIVEGKTGAESIKNILSKRTRIAATGKNAGKKQYKIRPGPDPLRPEETAWMTHEEILVESRKPSHNWIDAGSGPLGRLLVEVIGCDNLPQLDVGGFAGNLTDAFVSLVFEDAVVQTDVIDDCLNPRWMPWSQRAFIFHVFHSSSQLFIGVFDNDAGLNPADDHDAIGRVSVDVSNLRNDTIYDLKYNLYSSAKMSSRKPKGSITLRLRLELFDERKVLLSNLEPPPHLFVNTKTRRDFRVLRYTCVGKFDTERYNIKVINAYVEELLSSHKQAMFYLNDAVTNLILWRGSLPISLGSITLNVPVHSMTAFVMATVLVEHPQLLPSFFFGCFAWFMIATNAYRRGLPDVWMQCKSFAELVEILVRGRSSVPPHTIEPFQNSEETQAFLEAWTNRIKMAEEKVTKQYEEAMKEREAYEREMEEVGEEKADMSTKTNGVSIDPFKPILFPVQRNLAMVIRYLRTLKYIVTWEECYISFWVTVGCGVLSIVFFFIPWFFVIKWISRIAIWAIFGPWMKLVDIYVVSKEPLSEEEEQKKQNKEKENRFLKHTKAIQAARIKREDGNKLKAMKKYMFGKFVIRIPVLKEDRYRDHPLPESSATPYKPDSRSLSELAMEEVGYRKTRVPGQHLEGDMIPQSEAILFTEAPTGQPTAKPALLNRETDHNAPYVTGPDSTAAAYAKIISIVFAAGIVTWLGVPILASVTEYALSSLYN